MEVDDRTAPEATLPLATVAEALRLTFGSASVKGERLRLLEPLALVYIVVECVVRRRKLVTEREAVFLGAKSSLSLGTAEHSPWYTSPVVLSRCCYCHVYSSDV